MPEKKLSTGPPGIAACRGDGVWYPHRAQGKLRSHWCGCRTTSGKITTTSIDHQKGCSVDCSVDVLSTPQSVQEPGKGGRVVRIEQESACTIYILNTDHTYDQILQATAANKMIGHIAATYIRITLSKTRMLRPIGRRITTLSRPKRREYAEWLSDDTCTNTRLCIDDSSSKSTSEIVRNTYLTFTSVVA